MNGFLVIDKPAGVTSHDVVSRVRKIVGEKSVGHLGTLDPMATGVLPLVLGKYTRLAQFFQDAVKTYQGKIRLGFSTSTYDAEGEIVGPIATHINVFFEGTLWRGDPDSRPMTDAEVDEMTRNQILEDASKITAGFVGTIEQIPPPFSAKKIAGVPAYKKARKGESVELKAKTVTIHSFELTGMERDLMSFTAKVSAGTYVRSLAHELGQKMGCGAHLAELRRTHAGEFSIDQAVTLDELQRRCHAICQRIVEMDDLPSAAGLEEMESVNPFIHPRLVLTDLTAVTAPREAMNKIIHGNPVNLPEFSKAKLVRVFENQAELIAIASRVAGTLFQPRIVLI